MAKGYWLSIYRSVSDPAKLAEYGKAAAPLIQAAGGRFLARGNAVRTFEGGGNERTVVVEFDSVELAIAAYQNPGYQAARRILEGAVDREVRILEGAE